MTDTIKTYQQLGRFIMNEVYNVLLDTPSHTILYNTDLTDIINRRINRNPHIDKEYAMYSYNHGHSHSSQFTSRWQNVLYYYLAQHKNAGFLKIEDIISNETFHHYYVMLNHNVLNNLPEFRESTDMSYMFDLAQQKNKENENRLLAKSAETELQKLSIMYIRRHGIANTKGS